MRMICPLKIYSCKVSFTASVFEYDKMQVQRAAGKKLESCVKCIKDLLTFSGEGSFTVCLPEDSLPQG